MDNILDTIIKISSALLTPTLAVVGAFILVNQYRLQKLRWRLDLYDKRYPVFINTMEYLSNIAQHHDVTDEVLFKFLRGSKDKEFLFGEDMKKYLEELYLKGLDLQLIEIDLKNVPVGKKRNQMVEQSSAIFKWFIKQFDVSKRLFAKYLAVSGK
jgi:hypothetical protein